MQSSIIRRFCVCFDWVRLLQGAGAPEMRQVLVVLHATLILFQARVQKKDRSDQLLDRIAFGDTPGYIKRTQREKEES